MGPDRRASRGTTCFVWVGEIASDYDCNPGCQQNSPCVGVVYMFPQSGKVLAYSTMLFAWSFTEVVRYSYYAYNLRGKGVPSWLIWLRYNTFYVLYPLGVASEMIVTMSSLGDADKSSKLYGWTLRAILVIYIPGTCTSN